MRAPALSRRGFLGGGLALAGAVAARGLSVGAGYDGRFLRLPVAYGDGINDDAAGLQALFDGEPVEILADGVAQSSEGAIITGARFLLSRTLVVGRGAAVDFQDVEFRALPSFPQGSAILHVVSKPAPFSFTRCLLLFGHGVAA